MRIKSFSEARGIFDQDEFSLEPHIYCFGGGGDSGGGGSSSSSDSDVDAQAAAAAGADYGGGMSGSGANSAGAGAGSHSGGGGGGGGNRGGGGNDVDAMGAAAAGADYGFGGSGGVGSDPSGMADLAAQAEKAGYGVPNAAAAGAALAGLDSGLGVGGDYDFYPSPTPAPTYPDVTDIYGKPKTEAEVAAAKAGVPKDVFVTNKGNIVRSRDGTPVTSSRSVAEAAKAAGTTTADVMDAIKGAAGTDFGEGFGTTPGSGSAAQGPQGTAVTQAALEPAKVEAARQVATTPQLTPELAKVANAVLDQAVPGRVATGVRADPVMSNDLFMDTIDVLSPEAMNNPPSAIDPSRPAVSIRAATPAEQISAQAMAAANQLFGPGRTRPSAAEVQAAAGQLGLTSPTAGMQPTTTEVDAYNAAINNQIADQLGIASYDPATYGRTGPISQVSTAPISQADYDSLQAGRGVIQGDAFSTVNSIVDQAINEVAMETGIPASQMQDQIAAGMGGRGMSTRPSGTPGMGIANIGGIDYSFDTTVPADQRTYTQATPSQVAANQLSGAQGAATDILSGYDDAMARAGVTVGYDAQPSVQGPTQAQGPMDTTDFDRAVAIEEGRMAARDQFAAGQAAAGQTTSAPQAPSTGPVADIEVTYGPDDLAKAQADLEAARGEAYAEKQFGFDTGLPESMNIYGAKIPTGVGVLEGIVDAVFQPDAALANAIAERGIKTLDGASAEGSPNYNPNGLEVVTAGGPLSEGGRTAAYDAAGNIVYDSNPYSSLNPFGEGTPENIQEMYSRMNAAQEAERGDGGGGMTPMPFVGEETPAEEVPEEYKGKNIIKPYEYTPRGPISYSYTGLPSLAPQKLKPSYRAPKTFSPLFPVS